MNFGEALDQLKLGNRVYRSGWNGKGMWLVLVPGSTVTVAADRPLGKAAPALVGSELEYQPHIDMKTADARIVPWVASQTDLLADDWVVRIERDGGSGEPLTDAKMREKVRNGEWTINRYRDELGLPTAPVAPSATTTAQDAGITLTVYLDGKVLYDAIRPHSEAERARWRLRHGNWPLT